MFIIKWLSPKLQIYYKYSNYLHHYQTIGYVNQFGHEILDINFVYNNRVWTYEEYINRKCFKKHGLENLYNKFFKYI